MLLQEQFLDVKKKNNPEEGRQALPEFFDSAFELIWREETGSLIFKSGTVEKLAQECVVTPKPCFPWSKPLEKISLRNYENQEKAFVSNIEDLDQASRSALMSALKEACFYFAISKIESIKDDFELRVWKVLTQQGERSFQTKLTGWPTMVGPGRYIIRDVQKDLYVIESLSKLDAKSQELFWPLSN